MPIFDRETTKHSPRSPHLRHHSGDAFQRDANATYGMGISRGHSPTACQLRKHRNTRTALQVAGSTHPILHSNGKRRVGDSSSVSAQRGGAGIAEGAIHEPKPSAVFKDAEHERDDATNLPPKPMDYSQDMSFVDLTSRRQLTPVFDKPAFSRFCQIFQPRFVVHSFGKIVKRQVCQKRG